MAEKRACARRHPRSESMKHAIQEAMKRKDRELEFYAWPGGYPIFYLTADGGVLCPKCASKAFKDGLTNDPCDTQWYLVDLAINEEDNDLYCDDCNEKIGSAYGDDDEEKEGED